jgi:hypothetical protein
LFLGFLFCFAAVLPAWGRKEKTGTDAGAQKNALEVNAAEEIEAAEAALVRVSGRIRLVGSGPMPELVITGPDREWYVSREDEHLLKDLQHRIVTVEGFENVVEMKFANGLSAGEWRTLKDIKIISVE